MKKHYVMGIVAAVMIGVSQMAGCTVESGMESAGTEKEDTNEQLDVQVTNFKSQVMQSYHNVESARVHGVSPGKIAKQDRALVWFAVKNMNQAKVAGLFVPPAETDQAMRTYEYVAETEDSVDYLDTAVSLIGGLSEAAAKMTAVMGLLDKIVDIMQASSEVATCVLWANKQNSDCLNAVGINYDGFTTGEGLCAFACCLEATLTWMCDCLNTDKDKEKRDHESELKSCETDPKITGPNKDCAYSLLL